jgi:fermentation-respiration switch protein FrsA (DUF1100 family)
MPLAGLIHKEHGGVARVTYDRDVLFRRTAVCLLATACLVSGCAAHAVSLHPVRAFDTTVALHERPLTVHVTSNPSRQTEDLLIYVTGDGGWRGKDRDVYSHLQAWGYSVAGFSAPDYLKSLPGEAGTTTPTRLAADFTQIIRTARQSLGLSESVPVVLVGVSRGADLAVVAAGQASMQAALEGVVAIGLTREEEYVHRRRRAAEAVELYDYLPRLGDIPLSVIQSTGDNYVPAGEARELFGADTPVRRFHAIVARNHSFSNARPALYESLRASLTWLERLAHPAMSAPGQP